MGGGSIRNVQWLWVVAVLEAMASGLPVVVTAGGPTDDFVLAGMGMHISATIEQVQYVDGASPLPAAYPTAHPCSPPSTLVTPSLVNPSLVIPSLVNPSLAEFVLLCGITTCCVCHAL